MEKELTKEEMQAELNDRSASLNKRIEGLEDEMTSTPDEIRAWLRENPLYAVGGALAVGLIVGYLVKHRIVKKHELSRLQEQLMEHYLDAMEDRLEYAQERGLSEQEAMREALNENVPLIVFNAGDGLAREEEGGGLMDSISFMAKTTFGFVLRELADDLVHNLIAGAKRGGRKEPKRADTEPVD